VSDAKRPPEPPAGRAIEVTPRQLGGVAAAAVIVLAVLRLLGQRRRSAAGEPGSVDPPENAAGPKA
jgi:hypothetical protein